MAIHLLGAGPGPADLLTLRASRVLASCDVVLAPLAEVDAEVLAHCRADVVVLDAGQLEFEQVVQVLLAAHEMGHALARVVPGRGAPEGRLADEVAALDAAGVPWELTPGVSLG